VTGLAKKVGQIKRVYLLQAILFSKNTLNSSIKKNLWKYNLNLKNISLGTNFIILDNPKIKLDLWGRVGLFVF
jgi:hypothetical protein